MAGPQGQQSGRQGWRHLQEVTCHKDIPERQRVLRRRVPRRGRRSATLTQSYRWEWSDMVVKHLQAGHKNAGRTALTVIAEGQAHAQKHCGAAIEGGSRWHNPRGRPLVLELRLSSFGLQPRLHPTALRHASVRACDLLTPTWPCWSGLRYPALASELMP